MPISGSGKGLMWILGGITDKQIDWCNSVINRQGGIVAEPILDKVEDFAMEFYLNKGSATYAGYSLFNTASSGAYIGNDLISDDKIEDKLTNYIPLEILLQLRKSLSKKLTTLFPNYRGYVGVDMMICKTNLGFQVQPCVEINMRMNMGMVSRLFHNQYMTPERRGRFVVDYYKKSGNALKFHHKQQQELPLKVNDGKIISGYLSLTPVAVDTHYTVYVVVE